MNHRNYLFRKFQRSKNSVIKQNLFIRYKNLRNSIKNNIADSKKQYFNNYFEYNKNNISKIWEGIRSIVNLKNKSANYVTSLNHQGSTLSDQQQIAEVFNTFFMNIGPNIAKKNS